MITFKRDNTLLSSARSQNIHSRHTLKIAIEALFKRSNWDGIKSMFIQITLFCHGKSCTFLVETDESQNLLSKKSLISNLKIFYLLFLVLNGLKWLFMFQ